MTQYIPILAANLARALSALTRGLTYPSESDYPFEPFWADLGPEEPLTAESFRTVAGIGRRYEIWIRPAQDTFDRLIGMWKDATAGAGGEEGPYAEYASIFRMLATLMEAAMADLSTIHVGGEGVVRARIFLVGRLPDGRLAGLRSISIET